MSNNKQSSVDWLVVEIMQHQKSFYGVALIPFWLVEQAKAMHKQEIIAAKDDNYVYGEAWEKLGTLGEQYYNETFGGNNEQQ